MITWKNMDTLAAYAELQNAEKLNLVAAMTGDNGAERVKNYTVPMGVKSARFCIICAVASWARLSRLTALTSVNST